MDAMDLPAVMCDAALTDLEKRSKAGDAAGAQPMDEDAFRAFYDRTARPLWAYLVRITSAPAVADDLLQEAYYRFYRAGAVHQDEAHRRNSLYRIATNLVRDRARRKSRAVHIPIGDDGTSRGLPAETGTVERLERRSELERAMARLEPWQREMLWLAYAEGCSHDEIGSALGVKPANVRSLLFRARRRMARLLRSPAGYPGGGKRHG